MRVLMFHRFAPAGSDDPRRLTADVLASHLDHLVHRHPVWTPEEHLAALSDTTPCPDTAPVILTVDDGYADFRDVALPVFRRFGLPVTLFAATGFLSGETWFWWDRLAYVLETAEPGRRELRYADASAWGDPSDPTARTYLWHRIADRLSVSPDDVKERALRDLAETCGVEIPATPPERYAPFDWEQAATMKSRGVRVESHTWSHPILSRVDADRARDEIARSRDDIAERLGRESRWFCYPQGAPHDYLPETVELVREAGFAGAYVAHPDPHDDGDPMTLPRWSVGADPIDFRWMLCGAEHLFARLKGGPSSVGRTP